MRANTYDAKVNRKVDLTGAEITVKDARDERKDGSGNGEEEN